MDAFDEILADSKATEGPDTSVEVAENAESTEDKPKYPLVLATFEDENDPGLAQYGTLRNSLDFSKFLTFRNITEKNMGVDGMVPPANVYAAMSAKRNPLPVVIVNDVALLPDAAIESWDNRPVRGDGDGGSGSTLSDEDLVIAYGSALARQDKREKLLKRSQESFDKINKLVEKRVTQLKGRNLWSDDINDKAARAYTEAESAKDANKQISDDSDSESDSDDK